MTTAEVVETSVTVNNNSPEVNVNFLEFGKYNVIG